jgi:flagellar biosynthetic protein FlhB
MPDFDEKTEKPTQRRRQKAREEGQIPRSRELSAMASTAGILIIFYFLGHRIFQTLSGTMQDMLSFGRSYNAVDGIRFASMKGVGILIPVFIAAVFMAIFSNVVQGGFVLRPMKAELGKVNPLEGMKRIFSRYAAVEFFKGLVKFSIGGYLIYFILKKKVSQSITLQDMDPDSIALCSWDILLYALKIAFMTFFIISILDYINERWKYERSLRMTKEEVRDDFKETEGNPTIKARIKSIQREMARKRMMQEVPRSTVVITNPTHYAVALKYVDGKMSAPRVVAKGSGHIALKIRDIARKNLVPIVEDKPLARALYRVDLEAEIPHELYRAVAKILAYIYRLRRTA